MAELEGVVAAAGAEAEQLAASTRDGPADRSAPVLEVHGLSVTDGRRTLLRDVNLDVPPGRITCLIGPSGAGKTTLLRCLNRMVDLTPELRVEGEVIFDGTSIYSPGVDADRLRTRVGMLFQRPTVFPCSIEENAIFGLRRAGDVPRSEWAERAETALRKVSLWPEVEDRLGRPAAELSTGQQQRLCLARTLALEPEVVLMDEPTSSLDVRATAAIEELVFQLRRDHTIVLVTHDLEQARRVADRVACLCLRDGAGELVPTRADDAAAAFVDPDCLRDLEREEP